MALAAARRAPGALTRALARVEQRCVLPATARVRVCQAPTQARALSTDEASHADFKPKRKPAPPKTVSVEDTIKKDISSHRIFVYMKGRPEAPQCGFSNMVCRILDAEGAKYGSRNVLEDNDVREGIKKFTDWPTIPQVFVDGEFIGGCDILTNLHKSGELAKVLNVKK